MNHHLISLNIDIHVNLSTIVLHNTNYYRHHITLPWISWCQVNSLPPYLPLGMACVKLHGRKNIQSLQNVMEFRSHRKKSWRQSLSCNKEDGWCQFNQQSPKCISVREFMQFIHLLCVDFADRASFGCSKCSLTQRNIQRVNKTGTRNKSVKYH